MYSYLLGFQAYQLSLNDTISISKRSALYSMNWKQKTELIAALVLAKNGRTLACPDEIKKIFPTHSATYLLYFLCRTNNYLHFVLRFEQFDGCMYYNFLYEPELCS